MLPVVLVDVGLTVVVLVVMAVLGQESQRVW